MKKFLEFFVYFVVGAIAGLIVSQVVIYCFERMLPKNTVEDKSINV
jgi:hypothetical protein